MSKSAVRQTDIGVPYTISGINCTWFTIDPGNDKCFDVWVDKDYADEFETLLNGEVAHQTVVVLYDELEEGDFIEATRLNDTCDWYQLDETVDDLAETSNVFSGEVEEIVLNGCGYAPESQFKVRLHG